jgi:hypothetical protein
MLGRRRTDATTSMASEGRDQRVGVTDLIQFEDRAAVPRSRISTECHEAVVLEDRRGHVVKQALSVGAPTSSAS